MQCENHILCNLEDVNPGEHECKWCDSCAKYVFEKTTITTIPTAELEALRADKSRLIYAIDHAGPQDLPIYYYERVCASYRKAFENNREDWNKNYEYMRLRIKNQRAQIVRLEALQFEAEAGERDAARLGLTNMAKIEFTMNLNCDVRHDAEAGVYVSHCPTLGVFSQGETEDEALEAVKAAITLHVTTAFDFGRMDKVFRKAGLEKFSCS